MSLIKMINNYTSYNAWANQKIVQWLKVHDEKLLYTTTSSSFKSIDYTLQHILRSQRFWFTFIMEEDISKFDWKVREQEVALILKELVLVSEEMKLAFSNFSEVDVLKVLYLDMPWAKNSLSRYEYMMHVINHSTFHRGQIITMARAIGITAGIVNTDYNMFNTEKSV